MASIGAREGDFGLQIAPMLDILFVLLLFFMVAAGSLKVETAITTHLPGVPRVMRISVQVSIDADGQVDVNGTPYDTAGQGGLSQTTRQLKAMLANDSNLSVVISPNPGLRQQRVVDVLDACSAAGVKNLAFGSSGE